MRPPVFSVPRPRPPDPGFLIRNFEPAYFALHRGGELPRRAASALRELEDCCACPRNCHVNRMQDQARVCGTGRYAIVSSAFAHFGEENCLRGWN
ncbi:MAG: radical SAM protein, partial [Gammaproteobacteria bacterium]|nr:radical SAM protein [Gammaproteobacteria bacterium]